MARRRNAVFHRFSRLRGLPPEEKMLMQRIANMLDAALNNRQSSNPFEASKNKEDRVLWPPTGLIASTGFRTLKLVWSASKSDQHHYYEIFVTNRDTGEEETYKSFTNEFRFKGANGAYTARVRSVGRDTKSSPWHDDISFTLGGSQMQIEGAKQGPTTLGTMVQDDIIIFPDYSVYAWGSVVLDKYAAGVSNKPAVFRLWTMPGANQTFDEDVAFLQEIIVLYPATESASNLSPVAHGGTIERPVADRPGSFETSISTMFSPVKFGAELVITFFLEAVNRGIEHDEVNLSLVLWGGFDGIGDSIPSDPWDGGKQPYVTNHFSSLRVWREEVNASHVVTNGRWFFAKQTKEHNIIEDQWTWAGWVRPATHDVNLMIQDSTEENDKFSGDLILFRRSAWGVSDFSINHIDIRMSALRNTGAPEDFQYYHQLTVTVGDKDNKADDIAHGQFHTWTFLEPPFTPDSSYLWGGSLTWDAQDRGWYFIVVCYEGRSTTGVFEEDWPKIRIYTNDRLGDPENPDDRDFRSPNDMVCLNQRAAQGAANTIAFAPRAAVEGTLTQDRSNDYIYSIGVLPSGTFFNGNTYRGNDTQINNSTFSIYQSGLWNIAIDNWDGFGFNPGFAELRDSSPWYQVPYGGDPPVTNEFHEDGRESTNSGSSMTAIHYLFNQGFGADIDWKRNSNTRSDGAKEYIFAENLIHLWQYGAIPEEFEIGAETLRDTGNYVFGGQIDFLSRMTPSEDGVSENGWAEGGNLSDIYTPARYEYANPNPDNLSFGDGPWDADDGSPNWVDQLGIVYGANDDGPEGTTAAPYAYPGQALRNQEHGGSSASTLDWRRPNTGNTGTSGEASLRTGVLNEPKTWDPRGFFGSVAASEAANGFSSWDPD